MNSLADGRISRLASYVEPDIYSLVQKEASEVDDTISNWIRRLILNHLTTEGKISPALMLKLASGSR